MKKLVKTTLIMVAACFLGALAAKAQMQQQAYPHQTQPHRTAAEAERTKLLNELNALQERTRVIQDKLMIIAQKAVEANPQLTALHNNLVTVYESKLTEYGYLDEAEQQKLQEVQQMLQTPEAGDIDDAERQRLTKQFHAEVAKMQEAQQKAQSDPEVQQAQAELDQARLMTMLECDPDTTALQEEHQELQSKINHLRQSLQSAVQ
ncbi:MAG: hypothetical protein EOM20_14565 [Spartobacteria bacterium]|nr:hypothetical protein [Spartobacteria bacterium]